MADFLKFFNTSVGVKISAVSNSYGSTLVSKNFKIESLVGASGLNSLYDNRFLNQELYDGNLYIGYPTSGTFPLISYSNANFNLRKINNIKTSSGVCSLDLCINNNVIGGFSGLTINNVSQYITSVSDNFIRKGDRLTVNVYNISGAINLECSILGGE